MAVNTSIASFLKEYYDSKKGRALVESFPILNKIPKDENAGGTQYVSNLMYGRVQGAASTYSAAVAGAAGAADGLLGAKWKVDYAPYVGVANIYDQDIKAARKDPQRFINVLDETMSQTIKQVLEQIQFGLFLEPGNYLAAGTLTAGGVLTLANASDSIKFSKGKIIQGSANDGTSGSAYGTLGYVISVDQIAGTVTLSQTATGAAAVPSGWATGSTIYVFANGDWGTAALGTNKFLGFNSWIPATAPIISDSFCGVNRSADILRLSGVRLSASDVAQQTIANKLRTLSKLIVGRGFASSVDTCWINIEKLDDLAIELEAKGVSQPGPKAVFGTNSITFITPGGTVEVTGHQSVPYGTAYMGRIDDVVLPSFGKLVEPMGADGLQLVRSFSGNYYEHRALSYSNLVVRNPGSWGRVAV